MMSETHLLKGDRAQDSPCL